MRYRLGKFVLSFVVVVRAIVSTAVDWNTAHLSMPPGLRTHVSMMLCFCCFSMP